MDGTHDRLMPAARKVQVALLSIALAGAVVIARSVAVLAGSPLPWPFLLLALLCLLTGFANFRVQGARFSFSVSDVFTMTAAVLFGPAAGTALVAFDALAMSLRLTRGQRTARRIVYNTTAPALAMWIAAQVFTALSMNARRAVPGLAGTLVIPLLAFAGLYFLLNTGFIAVAVAGELRERVIDVWRAHFSRLWFTYLLGVSAAGLVRLVSSSGNETATILLVVPLVVVLYAAAHGAVERLRERREYATERDLYATALRSTADAVMLTDVDRRVTFMNLAAERLTGHSSTDARGHADAEVFRVSDRKTGEPYLDPAGGEAAVLTEFVLTRPDGTECPIEEMHAPIRGESGEFRGLVRTFRDVRDRKAVEAERELLLEMERDAHAAAVTANRMKDEFLAAVSHELRTPATAILGWARLLRDGRLGAEASQRALAALERSARAQATMLDDLLDTSRMARGTLHLDMRRTDVMTPLREAIETLEPAFQAKKLSVAVNVPQGLPTIDADSDRLRQVFWNLLANAIKFTPAAGRVDITAREENDAITIEFTDTGEGIDPAFLPFVFDSFRQGDGSPTRAHGGLGLGLAIVRFVVESHGGTVEARSEGAGHGARFTVRLPVVVPRRSADRVDLAS
jgi:PAS domain S-box-containing protein